jgi:hypothetical protein
MYFVIYKSWLMAKWQTGRVLFGCIIQIRPELKEDKGLLQHELEHIKQWQKRWLTHPILYRFSKKYRLQCEAAAYKVQVDVSDNPFRLLIAARSLSLRYNLGITEAEAEQAILNAKPLS